MKRKHEGHIKGFTHLSRAWYGETTLSRFPNIKDEISFGFYSPEGGTSGEIKVRWILSNEKVVPRMDIYSDAWSALSHMQDLIELLGKHDSEDFTPEQFCQYLLQCGFVDKTEKEREPYVGENKF